MRVFISSVRKGLEEERDALPGIISALGHTPVRFEDFSAQREPSRQACLEGLSTADIYILLLGPRYGHRFADTGQSPTHDEWKAAIAAGKPRLVYRKTGVRFDDDQQEFSRYIGDYATGVFYDNFANTAELLTKIAAKLRELETVDSELDFSALREPLSIEWRKDFQEKVSWDASGTVLEIHVAPTPPSPITHRKMLQFSESLMDRVRRSGNIDGSRPLSLDTTDDTATIYIPITRTGSWDRARNGEIVGIRLSKSGQVSVLMTLPGDSMGSILDPKELPKQIGDALRLIGALNITSADRVAIGVGLNPTTMVAVDSFDPHRSRNRATGFVMSNGPLQVAPDESVSLAALSIGSTEVAKSLADALISRFNNLR